MCLPSSEVPNGLHGAQVQLACEDVLVVGRFDDLPTSILALLHVPTSHVHGSSPAGQLQNGLLANPLVAAGHNRHSAGLIRFRGELTSLHILSNWLRLKGHH